MYIARTAAVLFFRRSLCSHSRTTNPARYYYYSSPSSSSQATPDSNGSNHITKNNDTPGVVIITGTIPTDGQGVALHQTAQTERCFTREQVQAFGSLVGDENPLHTTTTIDSSSSSSSSSDKVVLPKNHPLLLRNNNNKNESTAVVHGMLVASLFSSIFGTLIPGAVYLEQSLRFVRPVYVEELVMGKVTIIDIDETPKRPIRKGIVLTCNTTVLRQNKVCVTGTAKVWLVHGTVQTDGK